MPVVFALVVAKLFLLCLDPQSLQVFIVISFGLGCWPVCCYAKVDIGHLGQSGLAALFSVTGLLLHDYSLLLVKSFAMPVLAVVPVSFDSRCSQR